MQTLDAFLTRLNPYVPGCPEPAARQALIDSARAFCVDTGIVRRFIELGDIEPGRAVYDIPMPPSLELTRVRGAWLDAQPLKMPARSMTDEQVLVPREETGAPREVYVMGQSCVTVAPTPDENAKGRLTLLVSTRPAINATAVDDALLLDWAEPVVMGALHRLALTPAAPYNSADLASYAASQYLVGASRAMVERDKSRTVNTTRMHGPLFGGRR